MGNYYSSNPDQLKEQIVSNTESGNLSHEQEFKIYDTEYYLVCIDDKHYFTTSIQQAKIYLQSVQNYP